MTIPCTVLFIVGFLIFMFTGNGYIVWSDYHSFVFWGFATGLLERALKFESRKENVLMKKIGLSMLFLLIGIFSAFTGLFVSKSLKQKIFLVICGAFFVITAISIFLNRKQ